jgi:hypothetical protein
MASNRIRTRLVRKLRALEAGELSREAVATWAETLVVEEVRVERALWNALVATSGADTPTVDRPYLYGPEDFAAWRADLEMTALPTE